MSESYQPESAPFAPEPIAAPEPVLAAVEEPAAKEQPGDKAASRGLTRPQIRRIATKAQEVSDASPRTRATAANLLGVADTIVDLTTAIMAAPRSASQPIADLSFVIAAEAMEAAVYCAALERDRMRALWSLLGVLTGTSTSLPAKVQDAAIKVARTARELDADTARELDAVVTLLRKG